MAFIGLVLLVIVTYLLDGVALKLLWGWFMVPTFGLPTVSLAQAIGISIIVGFLTHQHIPRDDIEQRKLLLYQVVVPILAIFTGGIVHLFM